MESGCGPCGGSDGALLARNDRLFLKSKPITWAASAAPSVDMTFLDEAAQMEFPEIEYLVLAFDIDVTTANDGTTFNQEDHARILAHLELHDAAGQVFSVSGVTLDLINELEYGSSWKKPATVSANTHVASFKLMLRVPFVPPKAKRPADYRKAVSDLRNGGKILITFSGANPVASVTIASGTVTVWASVVDSHKPELKSRITWLEYLCQLQEDTYKVGGSLRAIFRYDPHAVGTAGFNTLASTLSAFSRTLNMMDVPLPIFQDAYLQESAADVTADVSIIGDAFFAGKAWPIRTPKRHQKTTEMISLENVHLKFSSAPNSGALIVVCAITDRDPAMSARAVGAKSPAHLASVIDQRGIVKQAPGGDARYGAVQHWHPHKVRRLPVRIQRPTDVGGK
jgi:hypothetical protein